jgi:hypothetical protein
VGHDAPTWRKDEGECLMPEKPDEYSSLPLWARLVPLVVGAVGLLLQYVDRLVSGQSGDQTLTYGSVVVIGLGLGLSLDWLRKRGT